MSNSHPLKVFFPESGTIFVCRWWTYSRQHSVILARSEDTIKRMLASVYAKCSDANVDQIFEVELVAPSALMCQKASEYMRLKHVQEFLDEVTIELHSMLKHNLSIPHHFTPCDKWEPSYLEEGEVQEKVDEYELEWHPDCHYCSHGFKLTNLSPEQFYDCYHVQWSKVFARNIVNKSSERYVACYSKARIAGDDEKIGAATSNLGPHTGGVCLEELELELATSYCDALFYFKMLRELDIVPFQTILDNLQKADAIEREIKRESQDRLDKEKKLERASKVLSIFLESEITLHE